MAEQELSAPDFDEFRALALVALPLSCIDRPQNRPALRNYLYASSEAPLLIEDHEKNRAFYGCYDWHSAVHCIWTIVAILRRFSQIPIAGFLREKLNDHLTEQSCKGELEFFQSAGTFELPYGRSWLLKLFAELRSWNDSDAIRWTLYLLPLAEYMATTLLDYVITLKVANRTGAHGNSAYSLSLMLDYADALHNPGLRQGVENAARRLFATDLACPIGFEPSGADFLSPSLEEARLMSRVLDQNQFVSWFGEFMPTPDSDAFRRATLPVDTTTMSAPELFAAKSHLIGLSFARAEALLQIAQKLPADDSRVPIYQRLARILGNHGWDNMYAAGYLGSHWLATFALRYELALA